MVSERKKRMDLIIIMDGWMVLSSMYAVVLWVLDIQYNIYSTDFIVSYVVMV